MDVRTEHDDAMQLPRMGSRWVISELERSLHHHRPMTWPNFHRLIQRMVSATDRPSPDQLRTLYELRTRRA